MEELRERHLEPHRLDTRLAIAPRPPNGLQMPISKPSPQKTINLHDSASLVSPRSERRAQGCHSVSRRPNDELAGVPYAAVPQATKT